MREPMETFCPEGCYWDCEHRLPEPVQTMIENARLEMAHVSIGSQALELLDDFKRRNLPVYVYPPEEPEPMIQYSRDALIVVKPED